ncbi:type II toxin-antitoxin system RelE/ParE family toxin [Asticcacaulis sp. AND118]|uniref:type II toxin-antitoxin system RelE/ParE family toxin n=1 Tax=Asticcacaulis sp. AND118 TaxID=2840468 RepID=UPI001D000B27|nr:type II toxin-antitoxin system RelE/ParE family toxin [Asticcacaulis sp. AND118]UDF02900.1 type II toxin-antitoxin system RelE/ParE family toxin [Asticcacaulis sp. AND118]
MMIQWSARALNDRIQTFQFIAQDSVAAAVRVDEAVEAAAEHLIDFPDSGRPGRARRTREWVLNGLPYLLIYTVEGDAIVIWRVLHTSRLWPE